MKVYLPSYLFRRCFFLHCFFLRSFFRLIGQLIFQSTDAKQLCFGLERLASWGMRIASRSCETWSYTAAAGFFVFLFQRTFSFTFRRGCAVGHSLKKHRKEHVSNLIRILPDAL